MTSLEITILGCGNSAGTPSIGNYWGNCDPAEPKNRRTRPSIAVRSETTCLMVDTGPDFKNQVNDHVNQEITAVLYTHAHSDHVNGIDDLRILRYRYKRLIDVYGTAETLKDLAGRFDYLFTESSSVYPQVVRPREMPLYEPVTVGDITFTAFEQWHGTCSTLGFRFGNVAYSTDMIDLSPEALNVLKGVDVWIADAAGYKFENNIVHCSLKDLYRFNEAIGARRIFLTHMTSLMDYRTLAGELPPGYEPAHDGLVIKARI